MAVGNFEGDLAESLDAIVVEDEAIEQEAEQVEADADGEVSEDVTEGDEDAEPVSADEADAPEEDAVEEAADQEIPAPEEFQASWDGNPENVPDALRPYVDHITKTSRDGVTQWMQKQSHERHALQKRVAELEAERQDFVAKSMEVHMPSKPGPEATVEQVDNYLEKMSAYKAQEQVKQMQEAGLIPKPPQAEPVSSDAAYQRRVQEIAARPDFNADIERGMMELMQSNPNWNEAAFTTEHGLEMMFDAVKQNLEAAQHKEVAKKAEADKIRQKAAAGKRAVPKPQTIPKKKKATPAQNFADVTIGESLQQALDSLDLD